MPWNSFTRKKRRNSPPVYMDNLQAENEAKALFLTACYGNIDSKCNLKGGLDLMVNMVETHMKEYEPVTADLLNTLWESRPESSYLKRQFETAGEIAALINSATRQTTIKDIADQLFQRFEVSVTNRRVHEATMRHLVFAAIGWTTMLYTATVESVVDDLAVLTDGRSGAGSSKKYLRIAERPVGRVLRSHGLMPLACPPPRVSPSEGHRSLLSITHLNFFSLSRLGDATVAWVDDLAQHCDFDRYSKKKQLKLFRFPSICAQICLSESENVLISRVFKIHTCEGDCQTGADTFARSYLTEVLLSYRLLFGQHNSSRRLFRKRERDQAKFDGTVDPLLDSLCGERDMEHFGSVKELLRERGVYNADINFPHLRAKLMELADYSSSQRPRNLVEVWNDERDPERLFTFKALIIVGVVSITLSVVQIFVGFAQVVLSVKN